VCMSFPLLRGQVDSIQSLSSTSTHQSRTRTTPFEPTRIKVPSTHLVVSDVQLLDHVCGY
jgi:hypothetical protein